MTVPIHGQTLGQVVFTTGYAEILDMKWGSVKCEMYDVTNMTTNVTGGSAFGSKQYIPSSMVDPGDLTIQALYNPSIVPAVGVTGSVTVAIGPKTSTQATLSGTGSISDFSSDMPLDGKVMTCTFKIKFSGPVAVTAAT